MLSEKEITRRVTRFAKGITDRAEKTHLPAAYGAMWEGFMAEARGLEDRLTKRLFARGVLYAITADAADRVAEVNHSLADIAIPDDAAARRHMIADITRDFERILTLSVEALVPAGQLDEEAQQEEARERDDSGTGVDIGEILSRLFGGMASDAMQSEGSDGGIRPMTPEERAHADGAAEPSETPDRGDGMAGAFFDAALDTQIRAHSAGNAQPGPTGRDASVGRAPQEQAAIDAIHQASAAAASTKRPAMFEALDRMAAAPGQMRVHRHDESPEASAQVASAPTRIETTDERG